MGRRRLGTNLSKFENLFLYNVCVRVYVNIACIVVRICTGWLKFIFFDVKKLIFESSCQSCNIMRGFSVNGSRLNREVSQQISFILGHFLLKFIIHVSRIIFSMFLLVKMDPD